MLLRGPYVPSRADNRMTNEDDLDAARRFYFERHPTNLRYLLASRYSWMNEYVRDKATVIEVGCGSGFSKEFIENDALLLTDFKKFDWIDMEVDAHHTPFKTDSVDAVISSHMLHHLAKPVLFLREMHRILKRDGYLLISEINTSLMMRALLRLMRHDGWSFEVDVFDEDAVASDSSDPWSANAAIPQLMFANGTRFEEKVPGFKIVRNEPCECLLFPLSGGVTAKTWTINLPWFCLRGIDWIDGVLTRLKPSVFALGRRVVLRKV